jgi:hypothetical protein
MPDSWSQNQKKTNNLFEMIDLAIFLLNNSSVHLATNVKDALCVQVMEVYHERKKHNQKRRYQAPVSE